MARIFISHSSRDNEAAARLKAWLASQGFETTFLDFDEDGGIAPGTRWEDVPDSWVCPGCGAAKSDFAMMDVGS